MQTGKRVAEHRKRQKELIEQEKVSEEPKKLEETYTTSKDLVKQGDVQKVINEWNKLQELGIKPIIRMTTRREEMLKVRIREYGMEKVMEALEKVKKSDFLTGKKKDFIITFDFFISPTKFLKILEGFYDNREDGNNGTGRKTQRDVKPLIPAGEWSGGDSDNPFA